MKAVQLIAAENRNVSGKYPSAKCVHVHNPSTLRLRSGRSGQMAMHRQCFHQQAIAHAFVAKNLMRIIGLHLIGQR